MADKNDLNEPKVDSNYLDVLDSLRGHISRLWKGDYAGMTNLVTGMRRWVTLSNSNIKLVSRNADGSEETLFDSTGKADVSALSIKANTIDVNNALALKAGLSDLPFANGSWANVKSQRMSNTRYRNTTSKPIIVSIVYTYLKNYSATMAWWFLDYEVDDNSISQVFTLDLGTSFTVNKSINLFFIVPPNGTYRVSNTTLPGADTSRIDYWFEYR